MGSLSRSRGHIYISTRIGVSQGLQPTCDGLVSPQGEPVPTIASATDRVSTFSEPAALEAGRVPPKTPRKTSSKKIGRAGIASNGADRGPMSPNKLVALRDMPGVAELEARLKKAAAHPYPTWAPEADHLEDDINALAEELFRLKPEDATTPPDWDDLEECERGPAYEAWQAQHFAVLEHTHPDHGWVLERSGQILAAFDAVGVDIRGDDGRPMMAALMLAEPLICAAKRLHGASLPSPDREPTLAALSAWETMIKAEAEKHRRRRLH